jgi:hypothetical protein
MIEAASIEVDGNEVTITIIASTPEEAEAIAKQATIRLEVTPIDLDVVINGVQK